MISSLSSLPTKNTILLLSVVCFCSAAVSSKSSSSSSSSSSMMGIYKIQQLMAENFKQSREDWSSRIASWPRTAPVNTTDGQIIGAHDDNVTVFLGVPFGKNTSGNLRWAPPQSVDTRTQPIETTWYGKACPQSSPKVWALADGMGEDCLNLNIFKPTKVDPAAEPLPVMVWLFGGCYKLGSNSLWYNGANNIVNGGPNKKPVIIVAINYRVSSLGFLGGDFLQQTSPDGSTGTWGVQDQRLALQWVKANARNFGGDPSRITIFGESAGAGSTAIFLTSPQTWHLFDRAILESGNTDGYWVTQSMSDANRTFQKVAAKAGCSTTTSANDTLACLRSKPWQFFAEKDNSGITPSEDGKGNFAVGCDWSPVVDGVTIKMVPAEAARQGILAPVPVLSGTNKEELSYFNNEPRNTLNASEYRHVLDVKYGSAIALQIYNMYPPSKYESFASKESTASWQALSFAAGDRAMTCANRQMAYHLAATASQRQNNRADKKPTPTYIYNYQHENTWMKIFAPWLGVFHMTELVNVWDWHIFLVTKAEKELAEMFVSMWTTFATTGNPNHEKNIYSPWQPFTAGNSSVPSGDSTFLINTDDTRGPYGMNQPNFRKEQCDMWERLKLD